MAVSDDGSLLFFSTPTGVRVYSLGGGGGGGHGGAGAIVDFRLQIADFNLQSAICNLKFQSTVDVARLSVSIVPLGLGARPFTLPFEADAGGGVLPLAGLPFALVLESDTRVAVWGGAGHVDTLDAAGTAGDSWAEVLDGLTKGEVKDFWLKS
jgi:hypothetical protein